MSELELGKVTSTSSRQVRDSARSVCALISKEGTSSSKHHSVTSSDPTLRHRNSLIQVVPNPYENDAVWSGMEILEVVLVGVFIVPFRIVGIFLCTILLVPLLAAASIGFPLETDRGCLRHSTAISGWRKALLLPARLFIRFILVCLGFWCIEVVDRRRDPSRLANIIAVAPHLGLCDILLAYAKLPVMPCAVGRTDMARFPAYFMACAFQAILVDLKSKESKQSCKDSIAHRASPSWDGPPVLLFPEGSITNGSVLTQFKQGAFLPGQPITPVLLRIPRACSGWDPAWVGRNRSPIWALRLMCHLSNSCTLEILDLYQPDEEEKADAMLYASNVRKFMADELRIETTEHAYDDVFFYIDAMKAGVGNDFLVGQMKSLFDVDVETLKKWLKAFQKLDTSRDGSISRNELVRALGIQGHSEASVDRLLRFFDDDGSGSIEYREFVQCLALLSGKCSPTARAKLAFLICDQEGTGWVPKKKLMQTLDDSFAQPRSSRSSMSHSLSSDIESRLSVSTTGQGPEMLNFTEFCKVVEARPEVLEAALGGVRQRLSLRPPGEGVEGL